MSQMLTLNEKRIKEIRNSLGITQEDLAKRMNLCGKSSVCRLEKKNTNISLKTINRLANALNCHPLLLVETREVEQ